MAEDPGPDTLVSRQAAGDADDVTKTLDGYAVGEVIGRGGIGEVVLAHDLRIGRDVAIKRLRKTSPSPDEIARFMREARIQARLDHPAIPPVHDLGRDADGRPYFTMKRLSGTTLLDQLGAPAPSRPRMLRAFADVCLAIEFAHARGIVHRDLKPANVMVGHFGDVYILDWGLAKVVGEAAAELVTDDIDSLDLRAGDVLGTPGYMAPEQLQQAAEAGRPADVYALGAILFEILAGEPVHPRGANALKSTIGGDTVVLPAKRRPDRVIAPELDSLCAAMLAMEPGERPTARKVAERIEGYLDGDRDVARRKTMAVDLVWNARAAYNEGRRAEAMRAAGRALGLDAESSEAAELVSALMLAPPEVPPPELATTLREADATAVSKHARTSIAAYLALASFLPVAAWNGVRRWDIVLGVFALALGLAWAAWRIHKRPTRTAGEMIAYALVNVVLLGLLGRMAGPFTFVPGITCIIMMSMMAYPTFTTRSWLLVVIVAVGFLVPVGLELATVLNSTWEIRDGLFISHAGALELDGVPTLSLLIGASVATIVIAGVHASRIYRAGRAAQNQLVAQAWHLRQLLPSAR